MKRFLRAATGGTVLAVLAGPLSLANTAGRTGSAEAAGTITLKVPTPQSCCVQSTKDAYALFLKDHPNVKLVQVNIDPNNLTASLIAGNAPEKRTVVATIPVATKSM